MSLTERDARLACREVARELLTAELVTGDERRLHAILAGVVRADRAAEEDLEAEAVRLLEAHRSELLDGGADYAEALARIRAKLARDRGVASTRLSPERVGQLTQALLEGLLEGEDDEGTLLVHGTDEELRAAARRGLEAWIRRDREMREKVHRKIASMRRGIPEGSAEWSALQAQFLREELDAIDRG